MTSNTTTTTVKTGKVAAQAGNGFVSVRSGHFAAGTGAAVTAVIPGKGQQRANGAVIAFYADASKAQRDADSINAGDVPGWRDAAVVPAVNAVAGDNGAVSKENTKLALWLHAENVALWLAAATAYAVSQRPPSRAGRPGPKPGRRSA